jgi:hypothetical protein
MFSDAGLMSDFGGFTARDVEDFMDHIYAALGIEDAAPTEESKT